MTEIQVFYDGPIVKRAEAKERGEKFYFTGNTCKRGHVDRRYVKTKHCVSCERVYSRERQRGTSTQKVRKHAPKVSKDQKVNAKNKSTKRTTAVRRAQESPEAKARRMEYDRQRKRVGGQSQAEIDRVKRRFRSPEGKAYCAMKSFIRRTLVRKSKSTEKHLGYTRDDLIGHLEGMFQDGMSWGNYGEWEIDHIIPVSYYIKKGVSDPSIVNALSNLQPLWRAENTAKRDKLPDGFKYLKEEEDD